MSFHVDGQRTKKIQERNVRPRIFFLNGCKNLRLQTDTKEQGPTHGYDVNLLNFKFYGGRTKQPAFSVLNLDTFLHNSTPEKFGRIWRIERDEVKAIKFKIIAQIHF